MPKVLKNKHRDRIWRDQHGDIWFYDANKHAWTVAIGAWNGFITDDQISIELCGPFERVK